MFGQNKIVTPDYSDSAQLRVYSTFDTIQGEGPFAGRRAFFIRLAGCNLKCYFCDTDFEAVETALTFTSVGAIVKKARASSAQLIVITGGEPLAQDISELIKQLIDIDEDDIATVQIETSGTCMPPNLLPIRWYPQLHIVISPKTSHVRKELLSFANVCFKYVINARDGVDPDDGLPIYSTQKRGKLKRLYRPSPLLQWPIYVQPCSEHYAGEAGQEATTENTDLCVEIVKKYGYILSLRQHKIIGVE